MYLLPFCLWIERSCSPFGETNHDLFANKYYKCKLPLYLL